MGGSVGSEHDYRRTDMHCTNCSKNFVARLDFSLNGNHVVLCPWCLHEHCRVITDGEVTEARWESRNGVATHNVPTSSVWKSDSQPIVTSTAFGFLRDKWLNRSDAPERN